MSSVGSACENGADPACGTNEKAVCYTEGDEGFPGGYCSIEPCSPEDPCPVGASCVRLGADEPACYRNCRVDADCRAGYACQDIDQLWVDGGSHRVCYVPEFECHHDADCPAHVPRCLGKRLLNPGTCVRPNLDTAVGEPCSHRSDPTCGSARHALCYGDDDGFPGGYCTVEPCSEALPCPAGSTCARLGGEDPACYKDCASDADCRGPAYRCQGIEPLGVGGAAHPVCYLAAFDCRRDKDCPAALPHCKGAGWFHDGACER
jgi:hypothetical protein